MMVMVTQYYECINTTEHIFTMFKMVNFICIFITIKNQQENVFSRCVAGTEVVDRGVIEAAFIVNHFYSAVTVN